MFTSFGHGIVVRRIGDGFPVVSFARNGFGLGCAFFVVTHTRRHTPGVERSTQRHSASVLAQNPHLDMGPPNLEELVFQDRPQTRGDLVLEGLGVGRDRVLLPENRYF